MAWAPEGSVNQKHALAEAALKKQTQWVAEARPTAWFGTAVLEQRRDLPAYFTSFQKDAFKRQANTVSTLRKSSTITPSWKRWPCAGSPIHCR